MKKLFTRGALLACLIGGSLPCQADEPQAARQEALHALSSPDGQSSAPSFLDSATIESGTADTKGTVTVQGYAPYSTGDTYFHYQLRGEAPVSKGSTDEVDIGTVSGLTAGASVHAEVSLMQWPHQAEALAEDLGSVCREVFPKLISGFQVDDAAAAGLDVHCDRSFASVENLHKLVDGLNAAIDDCRKGPDKTTRPRVACAQLLKHQGKAVLSPDAKDPGRLLKIVAAHINRLERQATSITLWTLGATENRQKVSYFNSSDLSTLVKDHTTGYGVNVSVSRISGDLMYSGGFSYEKTYKSNDPTQLCSPVSGSTSLNCQSGSIGAPKEMFSRILFTEARWMIVAGAFAIAPRLEYDFTASKFAAKLPIYLAPNKDKVLTGGIALGYVTHGDGFQASVFINKAFSFF